MQRLDHAGNVCVYPTSGQTATQPVCRWQRSPDLPACQAGATFAPDVHRQPGRHQRRARRPFTVAFADDEWRPNDKLDINLALKYAERRVHLGNTQQPGKNFWFAAAQQEFCYNPVTLQPVLVPQAPQNASVDRPYVTFNCPIDSRRARRCKPFIPTVRTAISCSANTTRSTYVQTLLAAAHRIDVHASIRIRCCASRPGRYAQEPQNYEIQYNSIEPNLAHQLIGFLPYGFTTPFHNAQAQFSDNYDFSYERHFQGTDMSMKVTPYYRYATQQLDENISISTLLASPALNAGTESSYGVELQFTKGDFNRNGLSRRLLVHVSELEREVEQLPGHHAKPGRPV